MPKLIHKGSVKDIYENADGELIFRFSDRYSIYDWGQMPDTIPNKGKALASMGKTLLKRISRLGIKTHFLRDGERDDEFVVRKVEVPRGNIKAFYAERPINSLIPLEVIFRWGVPRGSSLLKRFPNTYYENERFLEPKIDYTTKLERLDRVLSEQEAQNLSGMNHKEWEDLKQCTLQITRVLNQTFSEIGMVLWDGKLEFAFDENRRPMLVDSIGLDELRLTYENETLSKEVLRQYYQGTTWLNALEDAKKAHSENFKDYCLNVLRVAPESLSSSQLIRVSDLYQMVANRLKERFS